MAHRKTIVSAEYEFDVFISYCRLDEWPQWVQKYFFPLFKHWLSSELGRKANVFVDYKMDAGLSWPAQLGKTLARSAVLVPLWTRNYFSSEWCTAEFAHMLARERECQYRTENRPLGLIIPAIIHDGEDFPWDIGHINHINLHEHKCVNVRMTSDGLTAELLSALIRDWMPSVKHAIENAPIYNPKWDQIAAGEFIKKYQKSAPKQKTVPRF